MLLFEVLFLQNGNTKSNVSKNSVMRVSVTPVEQLSK